MRYTLLSLLLVAGLAGCAGTGVDTSTDSTDGDYQFGDATGRAAEAIRAQQRDYCATMSPLLRAGLLVAIRSRVPDYPPSGLCTDAERALQEEIARQVADLPEGATVSIEQAREDQRRFEEMRDAGDLSHEAGDDQRAE